MNQHKGFRCDPGSFPLVGAAGVIAVGSQLLMIDVIPFFPFVDRGIDLMTDNRCRIQVKSARRCMTPKTLKKNLDGIYRFKFATKRYRNKSERSMAGLGTTSPVKPFHEVVDVVVLWGVDENRFWIVPASLLKGCINVDLGPDNSRGFSKDVPEMRAMLAQGKTQDEVAKHFGISQGAVSIRLKREGTKIYLSKRTAAIRACENAWEQIIEFGKIVPG